MKQITRTVLCRKELFDRYSDACDRVCFSALSTIESLIEAFVSGGIEVIKVPDIENRETVRSSTIKIDISLDNAFKRKCEENNMSTAEAIRMLLIYFISTSENVNVDSIKSMKSFFVRFKKIKAGRV